jgi:hypothetical protein
MTLSLVRFLRLPIADQFVTLEALVVVAGTRAAVSALPRQALSRWVSHAMRSGGGSTAERTMVVDRVSRAVRRVVASVRACQVPAASCERFQVGPCSNGGGSPRA